MSNGLTVLLVEDDTDTQENITDILELDGHRTVVCGSCESATDLLAQQEFMAAIIDWKLPDGDADKLIPSIAELAPDLPVIVVTGYRELDTSISALRAGVYDYILKPINADLLRTTLIRIAERRDHLLQIETAQQRLLAAERLAAIGQMVAGLAHESRNALQRSQACLETLTFDLQDRPESLPLIQRIQKALDDLHQLYEEVRDYAAPIILEKTVRDVVEVVSESWQHLLVKDESRINLSVEISDNCSTSAKIDSNRMSQVFRNIFENAKSACADPGLIKVRFSTGRNGSLRIEVDDNGQGIPVESHAKIFQPFFTTKTKGTGLGLAISKRIVEAHHGSISVDDNEHGGARFIVELPLE